MGEDKPDDEEDNQGPRALITDARIDAGENGTAIVVESGQLDVEDSEVSGGEGVRNKDVVGLRNSTVEADDIGYVGNPNSVGVFDDSRIEGGTTDILTYPGAQVLIYDTIASEIIRLTRESREVIDPVEVDTRDDGRWLLDEPGLYHISRAILLADNPDAKREYSNELLIGVLNTWDRLFEGLETIDEVEHRIRLLTYVYWLARVLGA